MTTTNDTQGRNDGTGARFVRLTTVGDLTTARVLAARLVSEGIETRLHGDALGPYPMTVGALAETQIWVLSDRIEEASRLLLDAEVNDALGFIDHGALDTDDSTDGAISGDRPRVRGLSMPWRITASIAAALLAVLYLLRLAAVY